MVQEAVAKLQNVEAQQGKGNIFKSVFGSFENGIADTVRGINQGSQSLVDGMKNLARNMALSFQEEFTRLGILNPVFNALNEGLGIGAEPRKTLGGLFGGIGAVGAVGTVAARGTA